MGQRLSEEWEDKEIDVAELQEWYKKFTVECPSGTLFMHEFKGFFGVTENQAAADYIENMFRAFDKNGVRQCSSLLASYHHPQNISHGTLFIVVDKIMTEFTIVPYSSMHHYNSYLSAVTCNGKVDIKADILKDRPILKKQYV